MQRIPQPRFNSIKLGLCRCVKEKRVLLKKKKVELGKQGAGCSKKLERFCPARSEKKWKFSKARVFLDQKSKTPEGGRRKLQKGDIRGTKR
jgi:hypothetical protein